MKVSKKVACSLVIFALAWTSCTSIEVFPKDDGSYLLIATSHSESGAYAGANEDASEYCQKRGKQMVMVDQKSNYQGMDKTAKGIIGAVNQFHNIHNDGNRHYAYSDGSRMDDYKVELHFKCK